MDISTWLKDWAMPLSAGATFLLAIAAILTIIRSDRRDERNRKVSRLGQILDWATDIISETLAVEIPEETEPDPDPMTKNINEKYERREHDLKIKGLKSLKITGEHIKIVALRVDKELYVTVNSLTVAIDDLLNQDWRNLDIVSIRRWLAEHESRIYNIAKTLLDETSKRLQKL